MEGDDGFGAFGAVENAVLNTLTLTPVDSCNNTTRLELNRSIVIFFVSLFL